MTDPNRRAPSTPVSCEVLVVGLGPVGAALAALLCDAGVHVLAIDRSSEVYPLPRAAHFDHEVMRVFQRLGIADALAPHIRSAPGYEFRNAAGEVLLRFGALAALAPSGWPASFMFNQPGLERTLRARLNASPHARIRLGARLEKLRPETDEVVAEVVGPDGAFEVRARYAVGCDGASSTVREAVGIALHDLCFDEPWLVLDTLPRPGCRLPETNLQVCDPARPTTCVLMGPGRHRFEFMLLPGESAEQMLDDAVIAELLEPWGVDVEIERKAVYRFHALVAERWRAGRVLLAGDAAHQMPPFAGQGMCAGIRDAANLAWKLEAVLRGRADDGLLATYPVEREPNVRAHIDLAIRMGRVVCTRDPEQARARDAQLLAAHRAGAQTLPLRTPSPLAGPGFMTGSPGAGEIFPQPVAGARLDDVLGRRAWLIAKSIPEGADSDVEPVALGDARLAPFPGVASWLTARGVDAVLVRPDRYVFGSGPADALVSAWRRLLRAGDAS